MRFGKITMAAVSALALVGTPVLAQATNPAAKLSVAAAQSNSVRAGAAVGSENELAGGSIIIAVIAAAAVIAGIIIAADGDDEPESP